jgi:ribosomal protein S6
MSVSRKYEIMILLTEEFNDSELKTWVFNYAKEFYGNLVFRISVISRGKHNLAYSINNGEKLYTIKFLKHAKYINNFSNILKLDSHV